MIALALIALLVASVSVVATALALLRLGRLEELLAHQVESASRLDIDQGRRLAALEADRRKQHTIDARLTAAASLEELAGRLKTLEEQEARRVALHPTVVPGRPRKPRRAF